ncbi:laccase 3 [Podospora didyma]|uniref:Laccase 3 n=1 Tax=Podospora didyma TaxID=330526 RepID=A0AAE0NPS3_9PEZI|nr:laccase 3 [Podospora didyma]
MSLLTIALAALGFLAPFTLAQSSDHECWDGPFNISTNFYESWPTTGVKVVPVVFNITKIRLSPDGFEREVLAINDAIPGPTIKANWGDTIQVTVNNHLDTEGTSIHFHGVRQLNTNSQDGVVSVTQCPIPGGGQSTTYTWVATQYGTSWYHGHYGVQAWDGLFGAIQIEGPSTAAYEIDLGTHILSDWTHATAESLVSAAAADASGVNMDNGLINGKNVFGTGGRREKIVFTPGARHRLRIINAAIDTHFKVGFDGHDMQVIAADFVPIEPFTTSALPVTIGQRYDVIITANQPKAKYWFRAHYQTDCNIGGSHQDGEEVRAVVEYTELPDGTPDEPQSTSQSFDVDCNDVPAANLVPKLPLDIVDAPFVVNHDLNFVKNFTEDPQTGPGPVNWVIDGTGTQFRSPWDNPVLEQIALSAGSPPTFDPKQQVFHVDEANKIVFVLVRTAANTAHPIHMHGHDFWIVGQDAVPFDAATFKPNLKNPPRRDVALLPANGGYLVIAFKTDNPGAWLLHCHIGWHTAQGFALTFLTREKDLTLSDPEKMELKRTCDAWKGFVKEKGIVQPELDAGV